MPFSSVRTQILRVRESTTTRKCCKIIVTRNQDTCSLLPGVPYWQKSTSSMQVVRGVSRATMQGSNQSFDVRGFSIYHGMESELAKRQSATQKLMMRLALVTRLRCSGVKSGSPKRSRPSLPLTRVSRFRSRARERVVQGMAIHNPMQHPDRRRSQIHFRTEG